MQRLQPKSIWNPPLWAELSSLEQANVVEWRRVVVLVVAVTDKAPRDPKEEESQCDEVQIEWKASSLSLLLLMYEVFFSGHLLFCRQTLTNANVKQARKHDIFTMETVFCLMK